MAKFNNIKPPKPIEISQYLGVNESVGDTEIKLGEAVRQENFRITKNYKPQKRPGHKVYINSDNPIRGAWYGELSGRNTILFVTGGYLYARYKDVPTGETDLDNLLTSAWDDSMVWDDTKTWDESTNPPVVQIGSIDAGYTEFLWFAGKVQIKTLTKWYTYDGTTLAEITPTIPLIAIATPPAGGGTDFEEINLLTGKKYQRFKGDNTSKDYFIREIPTSVDKVFVNGVLQTLTTHYTVNLALRKITFVTAPPTDAVVDIYWNNTNDASIVMNHPYMVDFGVENDTNLFLFGSATDKNTFRFSMVGDPYYFPANSFTKVGSNQFGITDLVAQQQTLLVYKEDSTYIVVPSVNPSYSANAGLNPYNYGYQDLNEKVGNLAPRGVQLIKDTPVSLDGFSMWLWSITSVENQRGVNIISDRLKLSLQGLDLRNAVTIDNQNEKEYWCNVGDKVYIWNYGNDTMYVYTNVSADKFFIVEGEIYYISGNQIRRFSDEYTSDDDATIPCKLYLGFTDFGGLQYRKMMRDQWIAIAPDNRTSVTVKFITDKVEEIGAKTYTVSYRFLDFDNVDFNDYSFLTNVNPQPKALNAKAKKFTYLQVLFENDTANETLTILKLLMNAQVQGYSR